MDLSATAFYTASAWVIPVLLAITLHEAAHGFVSYRFGDDTAWRLGRVSSNPFKHIDPFGTVLLPALLLLLLHAPFLFGYAKPVPVKFGALRNPRHEMVLVSAAGPATNLVQAFAAAFLVHIVVFLPDGLDQWMLANLRNAIVINVVLALVNMIPLPPLDGGRVAVGLLPDALARLLAGLERSGMLIIMGLSFVLPIIGAQFGLKLDLVGWLLRGPVDWVIGTILRLPASPEGIALDKGRADGLHHWDYPIALAASEHASQIGVLRSKVL